MDVPMTPAEELRAAAALIREAASRATEGMPLPWTAEPGFKDEWLIGSATPSLIANARKPQMDWITLMSPEVAEDFAVGLEAEADTWPTSPAHTSTEPAARRRRSALALARKILRRTS